MKRNRNNHSEPRTPDVKPAAEQAVDSLFSEQERAAWRGETLPPQTEQQKEEKQ